MKRPRIIVSHAFYGCESGCCGHVIEIDGYEVGGFRFIHPYTDDNLKGDERDQAYRNWAEHLIRTELGDEHVADLDWENSLVIDD